MNDFKLLHTQELLKNLVHTVEKIYPDMIFDAGHDSALRNSAELAIFDNSLEAAIKELKNLNLYTEPSL